LREGGLTGTHAGEQEHREHWGGGRKRGKVLMKTKLQQSSSSFARLLCTPMVRKGGEGTEDHQQIHAVGGIVLGKKVSLSLTRLRACGESREGATQRGDNRGKGRLLRKKTPGAVGMSQGWGLNCGARSGAWKRTDLGGQKGEQGSLT